MQEPLKIPFFTVLAIVVLAQIFLAGPAGATGGDCLSAAKPPAPDTAAAETTQFLKSVGNPAGPAIVVLAEPNGPGRPLPRPLPRLLAEIAGRFQLILPEYPLVAEQDSSSKTSHQNCTDPVAAVLEARLDRMGIGSFSLFMTPETAPLARQLFERAPNRIAAVIVQGLLNNSTRQFPVWAPLKSYWSGQEVHKARHVQAYLNVEGRHWQFTVSMSNPDDDFWCAQFLVEPAKDKGEQLAAIFGLNGGELERVRWSDALKDGFPPTLVVWDTTPTGTAARSAKARPIPASYSGHERKLLAKPDAQQAFAARKLIAFLDRATSR